MNNLNESLAIFMGHRVNTSPCKTCAFLPDSPERNGAMDWEGMLLGFAGMGTPFFCHYGAPCNDSDWPAVNQALSPGQVKSLSLCGGWFQMFGAESMEIDGHKWGQSAEKVIKGGEACTP